MNIELKSTGTLIDEYLTTELKVKYIGGDEVINRLGLLYKIIEYRLKCNGIPSNLKELVNKLSNVLSDCWDAQEIVMKYNDIDYEQICRNEDYFAKIVLLAMSAVNAQRLNAKRNKLIREIDELLGESDFTQLEKSYG